MAILFDYETSLRARTAKDSFYECSRRFSPVINISMTSPFSILKVNAQMLGWIFFTTHGALDRDFTSFGIWSTRNVMNVVFIQKPLPVHFASLPFSCSRISKLY